MVKPQPKPPDALSYIKYEVLGDITITNLKSIADDLGRLGLESGLNRYLINLRQANNQVGIFQSHAFAYKELPQVIRPQQAKTALLVREGDCSNDFIILTMRNAGCYVKNFIDEDKAIAWLEQSFSDE